jgi:hypothetical protein
MASFMILQDTRVHSVLTGSTSILDQTTSSGKQLETGDSALFKYRED